MTSDDPPWGDEPCEPNSPEWYRRRDWFMAQPYHGEWWWLSFVDDTADPHQFLGVAIVPGANIVQAAQVAYGTGCNPGGQVAGWPMPIPAKPLYTFRLLSREELSSLEKLEPSEFYEEVQP